MNWNTQKDFQICIGVPLITNLQKENEFSRPPSKYNTHVHVILISHVIISMFMSVSIGWKSHFA